MCAWYALKLTSTREDRDFWHTQYEALNELRTTERDRRLGRTSKGYDARSVRQARHRHRIAEEADAGTFDQPTEGLPAWLTDPCTQPDRYPADTAGLVALVDTTAEIDMAALLQEWRVPALSEGAQA